MNYQNLRYASSNLDRESQNPQVARPLVAPFALQTGCLPEIEIKLLVCFSTYKSICCEDLWGFQRLDLGIGYSILRLNAGRLSRFLPSMSEGSAVPVSDPSNQRSMLKHMKE